MIRYNIKKGCRIKSFGFYGIEAPGYWFMSDGAIVRFEDLSGFSASNIYTPCRSLRAFRRFIKKHNPKIKMILISRYDQIFDIEYIPKNCKKIIHVPALDNAFF